MDRITWERGAVNVNSSHIVVYQIPAVLFVLLENLNNFIFGKPTTRAGFVTGVPLPIRFRRRIRRSSLQKLRKVKMERRRCRWRKIRAGFVRAPA